MATNVVPLPNAVVATLRATLRRWEPSRPILGRSAELYLTQDAFSRVEGNWTSPLDREDLRQSTRSAFDQFIEHGRGRSGIFDPAYGRSGVAQMKVMAPEPGVRLFGGFIDPTHFVGIRLYLRDELPFKATGQKGRIDYKTLGEQMVAAWDGLLPGIPRRLMKDF
jgi:hypothetical protein